MSKRDTFDTGPDIREAIDLTEFTEALVRLANVRFAMSDEYLGTVVTRCRWAFLFCCVLLCFGETGVVVGCCVLLLSFGGVFWWCLVSSPFVDLCLVTLTLWWLFVFGLLSFGTQPRNTPWRKEWR